MKIINTLCVTSVSLLMMVGVPSLCHAESTSAYKGATAAVVDSKGNMRVPEEYRTVYQMLGTWAVAADPGPGNKEMHVVYASPKTISTFRKTGHYPDGTVLVKEVYKSANNKMTTGLVGSPGSLVGWFVMVKDDVGRFPNNKLWGDGWGWAWFDAKDSKKTTSTDYKSDCQACHVPAKDSDWIYSTGYPALKK
ncbi:MAG: cytochrome C [Nevskiaceae bacterium]|nr:MAG: cytochrome C [Nevskiaceae bacterium]